MRLECLAPTYIISSSLLPAAPPAGVVLAFHMEILKRTCTQDLPIYHFGGTDLSTTYTGIIYILFRVLDRCCVHKFMYVHVQTYRSAQLAYWLVLSPVCKQPDLIVTQHHGSAQQLSD